MASSYLENRKAFQSANQRIGVESIPYVLNDYFGPKGEQLAIDVATIGSPDAKKVVVITSGIHGVELPIGSALQCEWLVAANAVCSKDKNARFVFVHALNPYGAAHGLRNDQENIDLNRNFVDFSHTPKTSESYIELADAFAPTSVGLFAVADSWRKIFTFIAKKRGIKEFKQALVGGQYKFPDGLYFGGDHPSWTRTTWEKIAEKHIVRPDMQNLWHIDIHSGDGPRGKLSVLVNTEYDSALYKRVKLTAGCTKLRLSQPSFATLTGDITDYWDKLGIPKTCEVTPIAIENGTSKSLIEGLDVLHAMMTRNALFIRHKDKHPAAAIIIQKMRDTFNPPEQDWQTGVTRQGRNFGKRFMEHLSPR